MEPVKWGILSTARIGIEKVIPAMQRGTLCDIVAIASRSPARAEEAARALDIPKAYASYEELLADAEIEAVYNPLPNHMHVPWSARAMEAGKHVLCEKPIAMSAAEAERLIAVRERTGMRIEEAFMVREHPQWHAARAWVRDGRIGELGAVQACFAYRNTDPDDIRNKPEIGGGGLYDIGSYAITIARTLFEAEPVRVMALLERDPGFGTDRLTSAILDFPSGQASFICATQLARYQAVQVLGSDGWLRFEFPFIMAPERPTRVFFGDGSFPGPQAAETETFDPVDQYTLQGDNFARRLRTGEPAPFPLETAVANMRVLDALFRAGRSGTWETV
jgi:predicted dehydrogenase